MRNDLILAYEEEELGYAGCVLSDKFGEAALGSCAKGAKCQGAAVCRSALNYIRVCLFFFTSACYIKLFVSH